MSGTHTIDRLRERVEADGKILGARLMHDAEITYRQLDYWTGIGVLRCDTPPNPGSGSQRVYDLAEVRAARIIGQLAARGISPTSTLSRQAADVARHGSGGTVTDGPIVVFIEPRAD